MRTIRNESFPGAANRAVMARCAVAGLIAMFILTGVESAYTAEGSERSDAFKERNRLVQMARKDGADALPELREAITSEREVIRRTAARLLAYLGKPAQDILKQNLTHEDPQVRYVVVGALVDIGMAGKYAEELVSHEDARIRRRFFLDIMPEHILVDGEPPDDLIASLESAYDAASAKIRHEIIQTVAELPLTEAASAFLRRVADREKAVEAAEGDNEEVDRGDKQALIAFRTLLEKDIAKMRKLADAGKWRELAHLLEERDIRSWPETDGRGRMIPGGAYASEPAEAYYLLAQAYYELEQGEKAEQALRTLIEEIDLGITDFRERRFYVRVLSLYKRNYQEHLRENERARDRYVQMQFDYGNRLAAAGRDGAALKSYRKILEVEGLDADTKQEVNAAIDDSGSSRQ